MIRRLPMLEHGFRHARVFQTSLKERFQHVTWFPTRVQRIKLSQQMLAPLVRTVSPPLPGADEVIE
jgi:hypothetical protein